MADFHVRVEKDGLRLWKTTKSANGTRVRIRGAAQKVLSIGQVSGGSQIFRPKAEASEASGESNDDNRGY